MNLFRFQLGKISLTILFIAIFFAPSLALAQPGVTEQIVPENCTSYAGDPTRCGFCDLVTLAQGVMNFLVFAATMVAVLMFVWAGVLLVTGGSVEGKRTQAKKIFYAAIIGLVITLASWLIVNLLMTAFLQTSFSIWTLPSCGGGVAA